MARISARSKGESKPLLPGAATIHLLMPKLLDIFYFLFANYRNFSSGFITERDFLCKADVFLIEVIIT